MYKLFYWLPRILSVAFILFLSMFALDVFSSYQGWAVILPLLIHLIPSFVLLLLTLIAWKYELVGTTIYLGFAVFYVFAAGFDRPWSWYAFVSGPSALLGILYFVSYKTRGKTRASGSASQTH